MVLYIVKHLEEISDQFFDKSDFSRIGRMIKTIVPSIREAVVFTVDLRGLGLYRAVELGLRSNGINPITVPLKQSEYYIEKGGRPLWGVWMNPLLPYPPEVEEFQNVNLPQTEYACLVDDTYDTGRAMIGALGDILTFKYRIIPVTKKDPVGATLSLTHGMGNTYLLLERMRELTPNRFEQLKNSFNIQTEEPEDLTTYLFDTRSILQKLPAPRTTRQRVAYAR